MFFSVAISALLKPKFHHTNFNAIDGINVTITCIILDLLNIIKLDFTFEGKKITDDDNHLITGFRYGDDSAKNLTIINVAQTRDEGNYSCIATDQLDYNESVTNYLNFLDKPGLVFKTNETEIKTRASSKRVRFTINYGAYPSAVFYIFDPDDELIYFNKDNMNIKKYDAEVYQDRIEFNIKRPNLEDFGNYTIVGTCAGKNYTMIAYLIVLTIPKVVVDNIFTLASREIKMNCYATGYPKSDISWGEYISCTVYID